MWEHLLACSLSWRNRKYEPLRCTCLHYFTRKNNKFWNQNVYIWLSFVSWSRFAKDPICRIQYAILAFLIYPNANISLWRKIPNILFLLKESLLFPHLTVSKCCTLKPWFSSCASKTRVKHKYAWTWAEQCIRTLHQAFDFGEKQARAEKC